MHITQGTRLCIILLKGWGSQSFQGTSCSRGIRTTPRFMTHIHNYYIWCPLTQETRIYMYLVHGWSLNRFQDFFLINFLFQGNQDHPRGLWPTYQLKCHHTWNKNIHCLGKRIPIVFRDISSFPIPGDRMTSRAIYYFP